MSKPKKVMSNNELFKVAHNFGEPSDEDNWDPFEASEFNYVCSSESDSNPTLYSVT